MIQAVEGMMAFGGVGMLGHRGPLLLGSGVGMHFFVLEGWGFRYGYGCGDQVWLWV